ncbi:MAG: diversity-generating retroelement protein Avd [bacterium]|nr:diversity-generating retroelement protein Avd [bacterium]
MTIVRDENTAVDALAIVEKYEAFVSYLYPILQNAPRRHGVLRDAVLATLFAPIGGLYHAAKSRQVSRLYAVDAEFATLRSHLRFLSNHTIRIVGPKQHEVALALLAEPGRMLNAWQRKLKAPEQAERFAKPSANGDIDKKNSGGASRSIGQAGK